MQTLGVISSPLVWILTKIIIKQLIMATTPTPTRLGKHAINHNHRERKVIGGKHNVLVHYMDACVPDSSDVVIWNPFI